MHFFGHIFPFGRARRREVWGKKEKRRWFLHPTKRTSTKRILHRSSKNTKCFCLSISFHALSAKFAPCLGLGRFSEVEPHFRRLWGIVSSDCDVHFNDDHPAVSQRGGPAPGWTAGANAGEKTVHPDPEGPSPPFSTVDLEAQLWHNLLDWLGLYFPNAAELNDFENQGRSLAASATAPWIHFLCFLPSRSFCHQRLVRGFPHLSM